MPLHPVTPNSKLNAPPPMFLPSSRLLSGNTNAPSDCALVFSVIFVVSLPFGGSDIHFFDFHFSAWPCVQGCALYWPWGLGLKRSRLFSPPYSPTLDRDHPSPSSANLS